MLCNVAFLLVLFPVLGMRPASSWSSHILGHDYLCLSKSFISFPILKGFATVLFEDGDEPVSFARKIESISCSTPEVTYHSRIEKQ